MSDDSKSSGHDANRMWGGRFSGGPAEAMDMINPSIDFDKRLYAQDIAGSQAHCRMLMDQNIISHEDGEKILQGLEQVRAEIEAGAFNFSRALEDIHMNVEARLREIIGDAAGRLHTARSRNDQVATDFRLWVRDTIDQLEGQLRDLQAALIDQAEAEAESVMPGYTHLQAAQPVTFGHHMLAYVEMIGRDRGRFADCRTRMNECPLGSAALAGTSFPIDRHATATALGFDRPTANSMDGVADRDFAVEFLASGSLLAVHLSRLSEEIVNWCSQGFGFIEMSDAFTTGSSIMPQKRNPDAAELIRGKTGRVVGSLNALLVMMKGLPLTFCKDMQEDKEALFDAADTLVVCVAAMTGMVSDMKARRTALKDATSKGFITATDLADWLVRVLDMPFRDAHHVTGALVRLAEEENVDLSGLSLEQMQKVDARINEDVFDVLGVEKAVESRQSFGGTSPIRVREAVAAAREKYL